MFGSLFGKKKDTFASPFTGKLGPITETPDEAFAEKMNGDGFMVQPADGNVFAPADSTVNLQGKGFTVFVTEGQAVKKGDKLMTFDIAYVKANAPSDACLCVFTDLPEGKKVALLKTGNVKALEDAVEIS